MKENKKDAEKRLTWTLAGGLLRYALMLSAGVHFGLWAWAAWPRDAAGSTADAPKSAGKMTVKVIKSIADLPPPPSLEPTPEPPRPRGLTVAGNFGEVPLPVPDKDADVNSWRPDVGPGDPGKDVNLIVDPNINVNKPDPKDPWLVPDFTQDYSEPPTIIHQERPTYPDIARDSRVEGDVVLLVYVDEQGKVRNAVVQSSPGLPALDESAREAAMKCTFTPARQQGKAVGVWYNIVMQFRL